MFAACATHPSQQAVREAAALEYAVEQLRNAPNPAKRQYLEVLRRLPCSVEVLCSFKRVCQDGYAKHVAAFEQILAVKDGLGEKPAAASKATLERSRRELLAAAKVIQACVAQESQIHADFARD